MATYNVTGLPATAYKYLMRAYNTNLSQFVYWYANDYADLTGTYSGYPPVDLTGIVILFVEPK